MKKIVFGFLFSSFILLLSIATRPRLNFAFAYDASCDEAGENCCPPTGYQSRCAPTLECNITTGKCEEKTCGNSGLVCCPPIGYAPPCNTSDLQCNSTTNKCEPKSCGNESQQCCPPVGYAAPCNTVDLVCNISNVCEKKSCGNQGQSCCQGGYQSQCNSPTLKCDAGTCVVNAGPRPTIPVYDPGCTAGDTNNVKTALGCLPTDPQAFVNTAIPWAVGIGAGIAFLLGVFGATVIVLSAGNPEKMQAGKEMITSAISGLLIIIFAILILKVVGVDVLKLFPEATRTSGPRFIPGKGGVR